MCIVKKYVDTQRKFIEHMLVPKYLAVALKVNKIRMYKHR
jgi:hypothetical protein